MIDARTAFVGLGEGLGNVLMGLPLVDSLLASGYEVDVDLRTTPAGLAHQIAALCARGRERAVFAAGQGWRERYDLACLTHWWVFRGGAFPVADETRFGHAASEDEPEILADLAALPEGVAGDPYVRVEGFDHGPVVEGPVSVVIHPGCKPDPTWRARKVYPRWYEVVHRLKEEGAKVGIVGGKDDADLYVGEPTWDDRGRTTLLGTASQMCMADVVLSGDSGIHHLAVGLGLPTVALFGQSSAVKAHHPAPRGPAPVVLGPFQTPERFASLSARVIARAAVGAAVRARRPAEALA